MSEEEVRQALTAAGWTLQLNKRFRSTIFKQRHRDRIIEYRQWLQADDWNRLLKTISADPPPNPDQEKGGEQ